LDYLLLLAGAGLSVYLMQLGSFTVEASDAIGQIQLRAFIAFLPSLLRLSEGIILLLPVFFVLQLVRGRRDGPTAAEWLWLLSWFGTAFLTAVGVCEHLDLLPGFVLAHLLLVRFIWYIGFELAMAALAVVVLCVGFFRPPRPWTHQLGLALALWPVAPLAGILTLTKLFL
jgi:hypothetical protein